MRDLWTTGFRLWFSLARYPIGQGLLAAATDVSDPLSLSQAFTGEFLAAEGDSVYSLGIQRFVIEGEFLTGLRFALGRQDLSLSYGFGWNPLDLSLGLPTLQGLEERETWSDGLSLSLDIGGTAEWRLYGLVSPQSLQTGLAWEDLQGGTDLSFYGSGWEIKALGFFDGDLGGQRDGYASGLGLGVFLDLWGIGLYTEGAWLEESRRQRLDGGGMLVFEDKPTWLALAGLEYVLLTETSLNLEYFFSAEAWDRGQMKRYKTALQNPANITAAYLKYFTPGSFSQHYALLNLIQPWYEMNLEFSLTSVASIDGGALLLAPGLTWNSEGALEMSLGYLGLMDLPFLSDGLWNEVSGSPVQHSMILSGKYYF